MLTVFEELEMIYLKMMTYNIVDCAIQYYWNSFQLLTIKKKRKTTLSATQAAGDVTNLQHLVPSTGLKCLIVSHLYTEAMR